MINSFYTVKQHYRCQETIKKSKFISTIIPAETEDIAKKELETIRKEFYDATHNCWAYRIFSDSGITEQFSDDGEPSRSAGFPIIQMIHGGNFFNSLLVVTRYFGGIKLGVGGLIRAYGGMSQKVLTECPKLNKVRRAFFSLSFPHDLTGVVMKEVKEHHLNIVNQYYENEAVLEFYCEPALKDRIIPIFINASSGRLTPVFIEYKFI